MMKNSSTEAYLKTLAKESTPDLRNTIKKDPRFKVTQKRSPFNLKAVFAMGSLAMAAIILTVFLSMSPSLPQATTSIFIAINPEIQIDIDDDDEILEIIPLNSDATHIIEQLNIEDLDDLTSLIENIIEKAILLGYLDEDNPHVMYDVIRSDGQVPSHVLNRIESMIPEIASRHLPNLDMARGNANPRPNDENFNPHDRVDAMRENLIYEVLEAFPEEYTYEELSSYSVGELRAILRRNSMPNRP